MILTRKNRSNRRKTCPSVTLSTKITIWTILGSNTFLRGERLTTNRLRQGPAKYLLKQILLKPISFDIIITAL
jgi:hypothetical protein